MNEWGRDAQAPRMMAGNHVVGGTELSLGRGIPSQDRMKGWGGDGHSLPRFPLSLRPISNKCPSLNVKYRVTDLVTSVHLRLTMENQGEGRDPKESSVWVLRSQKR